MENPEEKIFYQNNDVTVTQSRFVSGGTTYAIRNILFVRKRIIGKDIVTPIFYIIAGIIFLVFSLDLFFQIAGGICVIIGILWLFFGKQKFSVRIHFNREKVDSFISKDDELVTKIVNEISNAMFYWG